MKNKSVKKVKAPEAPVEGKPEKAGSGKIRKEKAGKERVPPEKSKKNTSLRLDKQTLKALKIKAIENDTSVQKLIEKLILDYLES